MSTPHASKGNEQRESRVSRRLFLKRSGTAAAGAAGIAGVATASHASMQGATPSPGATPGATPVGTPLAVPRLDPIGAIEFFNGHEALLVEALTARILPGTPEDPGAREAGVVYYIDRELSGPTEGYTRKTYTQGPFINVAEGETAVEASSRTDLYHTITVSGDEASRYGYQSFLSPQELYRRGLAAVDAYSLSTFNGEFLALSEAQQDQVLTDMEADTATGFEAPSGSAFFTMLRNDTIEGTFSDPMYGGNRNMVGWNLIRYPGARGAYAAQEMADPNFTSPPISIADMHAGH